MFVAMQATETQMAQPFTGYQKLVIAILAFLQFTVVLDFMILAPLGDFLMKSLSISPKGFGIVVSSYAFSAGVSGILAAGFADKFDRKRLLLFFYAGFILGTLCCALAASYWMLLGARIITGLFGGVIGAITLTIMTDLFAEHQRGRVMGFVQMALAGSQILGIPIGLYLANAWGWHSAFLMIVLLASLIALVIFIKIRPIDQHLALQSDKNAFLHLWHAVTTPSYQTGFLATAFLSVGGYMLMPFSSAYLINNIRITAHELPMVFMFTGIASIVAMPLIGKLSDKTDKFILFTAGCILATIMVLTYTNLGPAPLWLVVLINMVMFVGIMSRFIPATALTMSIPEMKDRGAFMSVNSSLQQMAGGLAALFAGFIVTQHDKNSPLQHYDMLGLVVSAIMLISIFLIYRVSQMIRKKQPIFNPVNLETH